LYLCFGFNYIEGGPWSDNGIKAIIRFLGRVERIIERLLELRITGDGPRDTLIGPKWSLKKFEVINAIEHLMMDRDTWQGKKYTPNCNIMNMFI